MTIKTTRLKNVQLPKIETIDLSSQMNGISQHFSTGRRVTDQDVHHLVWNSTVYRNSPSKTWYEISPDGVVTTYFDKAPEGGTNRTLLLVISERQGESPTITEDELTEAVNQAIAKAENELAQERTERTEKDTELESKITAETERATQAEQWLQENINSEVDARMEDRDALQANINAEVGARVRADEELSKGLNDENQRAYQAEQELSERINSIDLTPLATKEELASDKAELITSIEDKQDALIGEGEGQNIKTVNGQNVLGEGNIDIDLSSLEINPKFLQIIKLIGLEISILGGTLRRNAVIFPVSFINIPHVSFSVFDPDGRKITAVIETITRNSIIYYAFVEDSSFTGTILPESGVSFTAIDMSQPPLIKKES